MIRRSRREDQTEAHREANDLGPVVAIKLGVKPLEVCADSIDGHVESSRDLRDGAPVDEELKHLPLLRCQGAEQL